MSPRIGEGIAWKLAQRSTEQGTRSTISDAQLPALLALERSLGTASAGQLAVKLIDRMFTEKDPAVQRTLAMEAKDPEGKISPAVAGEIATKVVDRSLTGWISTNSARSWTVCVIKSRWTPRHWRRALSVDCWFSRE